MVMWLEVCQWRCCDDHKSSCSSRAGGDGDISRISTSGSSSSSISIEVSAAVIVVPSFGASCTSTLALVGSADWPAHFFQTQNALSFFLSLFWRFCLNFYAKIMMTAILIIMMMLGTISAMK